MTDGIVAGLLSLALTWAVAEAQSGKGGVLRIGMTAAFFEFTADLNPNLRGLYLLPEIAAGTAAVVVLIVLLASVMSLRKVLILEPAVVFRG